MYSHLAVPHLLCFEFHFLLRSGLLTHCRAKIGLGHSLPELPNAVTKTTTANFEPSLDYIVTKIPRWDLAKFQHVKRDIGSSMKSVGEVMAIGRTFEESFQKAIRQVDPKFVGFQGDKFEDLDFELQNPTDRRWLAVGQAMLHENYSVEKVHELTKIDKWFLHKLQNIVDMTKELQAIGSLEGLKKDIVHKAKKLGFSDRQIANAVNSTEDKVRSLRLEFGIRPWVKKIDTLAAEFPADTNYLYTTYNASTHDVTFEDNGTIILGSGVYRIGSSVEFDWCAVSCTKALRELGHKTVMINVSLHFLFNFWTTCPPAGVPARMEDSCQFSTKFRHDGLLPASFPTKFRHDGLLPAISTAITVNMDRAFCLGGHLWPP